MNGIQKSFYPNFQGTLGARRPCELIYMGNNIWRTVCFTSGGGNRGSNGVPALYGAEATATPATQTNQNGNVTQTEDPSGKYYEAPTGIMESVMQFVSDNALWIGIGLAGIVAIMIFSKKGR